MVRREYRGRLIAESAESDLHINPSPHWDICCGWLGYVYHTVFKEC